MSRRMRHVVSSNLRGRAGCRRGMSLLETMAAVLGVTVILGLVSSAWHLLGRTHRSTEASLESHRQVQRLAHRFRLDAHEAFDGTMYDTEPGTIGPGANEPSRAGVTFTRADGRTVDYRQTDGGLERRVLSGEQVEHRELFRLPPHLLANPLVLPRQQGMEASLILERIQPVVPERGDQQRPSADARAAGAASRIPSEVPWLIVSARLAAPREPRKGAP